MHSLLFLALLVTTAIQAKPAKSSSCAILSIALPEERPGASIESRRSNFVRDGIIFLTKSSIVPSSLKEFSVGERALIFPADAVPPSTLSFFGNLGSVTDPLTAFDRLTSAEYTQIYLATRRNLHRSFYVPETRGELEAQLGYAKAEYKDNTPDKWTPDTSGMWFRKIVPLSIAKGVERQLYRPQAAHPLFGIGKPKITIATTVTETEIALMREDGSGDWDYYGYGVDGKLSPVAIFKTNFSTNEANSPHACMACHYSVGQRRFRGAR